MRYTMALWSFLGVDITGNRSAYLLNDTSLNISDISSFKQPLEITYIRWIYITLFGIIFLCCILGNFTVIYVILRHKKMRNITNFFLANLALSDLCVGIFCVLPNLSTFLSPYWLLGRVLCKLYYFIQCTSYTASVLILTVISLERYFAIIHPMFNKRVTRMCLLRMIVIIIWLCAAIYGTPNLIAYDLYQVKNGNGTLDFCVTTGQWHIDMEVYSILNFIVLYLLPLLLIVALYVRISNVLWRSGTNSGLNASSGQRRSTMTAERTCLRCPQCKQIVYDKCDPRPTRNSCSIRNSEKESTKHPTPIAENGKEKHFPLSLKRVFNPSQWTRSVDDISDEEAQQSKRCRCSQSANVVTKRSLKVSLNNRRKTTRTSSPLTARRKIIRLLICIILNFAICVLPHHIRLLWQYWSAPSTSFSFVHMLIPPSTFLFFYANSALNPFLYAFLSEQFRKAFKDLLPRRCRSRDDGRSRGPGIGNSKRGNRKMAGIQLEREPFRNVCRLTTSVYESTIVTDCI